MKKMIVSLACIASVMGSLGVITAQAQEKPAAQAKDLVAYYSYTGNTEHAAKALAEVIQADLLKIEDVTRPTKDEAYTAGKDAAKQGKSWPVKPFNKDVSAYDRIFVGCPVWFGMPTPAFNAFVEQVDFKGKQVIVFVTLGGGSHAGAIKAMTAKIEAKGGKVVSSFFVRTKVATKDSIIGKTKEIAAQYVPAAPKLP